MDNEKKTSITIVVAIIGALALIAVPIVNRLVDIYLPTPTPVNVSISQDNQASPPQSTSQPTLQVISTSTTENSVGDSPSVKIAPLIINDLTNNNLRTFEFPSTSNPSSCVGAYVETKMAIIDYELTVPKSWAVIIDSWKAEWSSGSYQNDGMLIITGEWKGNIRINIGAICAVPAELLQANLEIRRGINNDGRPEYTLP